jgi:N-hydroxyarylamine O-acetyltransferase
MSLATHYFERLELDPQVLDAAPTLSKLQAIQEAHLRTIPFENTAQHGVVGGRPRLDISSLKHKILDQKRGGFCFELNGLFSVFLEELGYKVTRVPAVVCGSRNTEPTHMTLVVTCSCEPETSSNESKYLVEVGFGEPPIHPVLYEFGEEQVTPEGMRSKIVKEGDTVTLCWFKAGEWTERFTWSYEDSIVKKGLALSDFEKG